MELNEARENVGGDNVAGLGVAAGAVAGKLRTATVQPAELLAAAREPA